MTGSEGGPDPFPVREAPEEVGPELLPHVSGLFRKRNDMALTLPLSLPPGKLP